MVSLDLGLTLRLLRNIHSSRVFPFRSGITKTTSLQFAFQYSHSLMTSCPQKISKVYRKESLTKYHKPMSSKRDKLIVLLLVKRLKSQPLNPFPQSRTTFKMLVKLSRKRKYRWLRSALSQKMIKLMKMMILCNPRKN